MKRVSTSLKWAFLSLACVLLSSCAAQTAGERMADMPHWMGGLPAGVPPRRGTPEYDAWMAARAEEAAKPKTNQKTDQDKQPDQRK
jgi:ABC-type sugar transport system substrate-binding protein